MSNNIMGKTSVAALIELTEKLGWNCDADGSDPADTSIEFRQKSPAGEDFSFCAYGSNTRELVDSICEYAGDFDTEEHVKMWLDAKEHGTGGVPSASVLVKDADAIQEMLDDLACECCKLLSGGNNTPERITLRKKIEDAKAEYQAQYGELDWQWTDEGLPWAIQDYHSSVGSVMDFTEDDWLVCKENDWSLNEVCDLCDEGKFNSDVETLTEFLSFCPSDMDKEDALSAVENFYTWRDKLLLKAMEIYG